MSQISEHAAAHSSALLEHAYQRYCGLELLEQSPGACTCRLRVTEAIDNLSHTLHGGVIYSMLDVVSMLATLPILGPEEYALTSSFNTMLMSASPLHSELEFKARVIRDGRNLIFTQADAWRLNADGSRTQVASAQLTKFRLKHQW
ncbi:PaaI family thioesterase [Pseudomonas wadenswilerensis]|uniref:PaaI family thioesterase n=1 Tax=Pseudomonas TaxID=286 RepID=UPI000FBA46D4|nr:MULTISPECIES: PaaI family thioesterase [Pseudomonas]MCE5982514.1 PaaI family thioesterase [Pseudomonas sp. LF19]UVM23473.1 PaaI family thioesterase [Pseudomonas wadenswilerensis]SPO67757.1 Thioesterase [Pseudomonas sp. JV241A]